MAVPEAQAEPVVPTVEPSADTERPDLVVPTASATTAVAPAATTAEVARPPVVGATTDATTGGAATTGATAAGTTAATTDAGMIGPATTGPGVTGRAQPARAVTAATRMRDRGRIGRIALRSGTTGRVRATGTAVATTGRAEPARGTARTTAATEDGPLLGPAPTAADIVAQNRTTAPPVATDIATIATDTVPMIADTVAETRTRLTEDRATGITAEAPITDREIALRDIEHPTAGGTAKARSRRAELGDTTATIAGLVRTVPPARVRRTSGRPSGRPSARRIAVRTTAASGTGSRVNRTAAVDTSRAATTRGPTAIGPVDPATPASAATDSDPMQRLGDRTAGAEPSTAGRPAATTVATGRGPSAPAIATREAHATGRQESVGPIATAAPPTVDVVAQGSAGPATGPRCVSLALPTRSGSRSRPCRTT